MAHEIRYIAFRRREVEAMVHAYGKSRGMDVPPGRIVGVTRTDDVVRLEFEDDNGRQRTLALREVEAVACVLAYCRGRRYCVAQRFAKRIEVTGNALVLVMSGSSMALNAADNGR